VIACASDLRSKLTVESLILIRAIFDMFPLSFEHAEAMVTIDVAYKIAD
jgi:hypothetical protein